MRPTGHSHPDCDDISEEAAASNDFLDDDEVTSPKKGFFFGLFDKHRPQFDHEWRQQSRLFSPRNSIPEASETFLKVMQQLDDSNSSPEASEFACSSLSEKDDGSKVPKDTKPLSPSSEKPRERKSTKIVKKAASFSVHSTTSGSSTSPSKGDSKDVNGGATRRMSVPCIHSEKRHVQWVDEAGVADLVSVRLIKPRIAAKEEKQIGNPPPSRSILRRLSGMH